MLTAVFHLMKHIFPTSPPTRLLIRRSVRNEIRTVSQRLTKSCKGIAKKLVILSLIGLLSFPTPVWAKALTPDIASQIQSHFDTNLDKMSRVRRKHYALRMFRITGSQQYLQPIISDVLATARWFPRNLESLDQPDYAQRRTTEILSSYIGSSQRSQARRKLLSESGTMVFNCLILYELNKLKELGLLETPRFENTARGIDYLKKVDWRSFVLKPEAIRVYSAQLANDVYYLLNLGIEDLRQDFNTAFQQTFPDREDGQLSAEDFEAKVYGLTHIIIASSRYYQQTVNQAEFAWIFQWFEHNINRILREIKADVLTEIALCYLLVNQPEHQIVDRIKQALIENFDPISQMIPGTTGSLNLQAGEHRNVLTVMVFHWPEKLNPGPYLLEYEQYRRLLPKT